MLLLLSLRCSKKFLASQLEAEDLFLTYMGVLGLVFPSKMKKSKEHIQSYIEEGYSITVLQQINVCMWWCTQKYATYQVKRQFILIY